MKKIIAILFRLYFFKVLVGRYIDIDKPKMGRFSKQRLKVVYKQIERIQAKLLNKQELLVCKSRGNQLMIYCGTISLSAYRGLRIEGAPHQYATLLVSDVIWKLYIMGVKPLWLMTRIISREPQERLNATLRLLCKYPFNHDPNGYLYELHTMQDHLAMDFTQCAVHQFMKQAGNEEEMDFFRNSWCLFDYSLPSYLIEGGDYEREHTLSHGDHVCDMKWYAKPKN